MSRNLVIIKGIKCDNSECDFRDDDVKYEDYPLWLNKPCPKCGQNLLTEKDFLECQNIMKMSKILGKFVKFPENYKGEMDVKFRYELGGDDKNPSIRVIPTETFKNDYDELTIEDKKAMNKMNRKWLEDKLTKAANEGKTKTFDILSDETKNVLLYVYKYENLILRYYFKCTDKDISMYKATTDKNNIMKIINTVPNVEKIFESCCV